MGVNVFLFPMGRYEEELLKARKHLKIGDHLVTMTYPLVKDNKLILVALQNVFLAMSNAMTAVLSYEQMYGRIPLFKDTFDSKFQVFSTFVEEKYGVGRDYLMMIRDVKEIIVEHEKSPIEFSKDDKFVICSSSYAIKTVSITNVKGYIAKTKLFIDEMESIVKSERTSY